MCSAGTKIVFQVVGDIPIFVVFHDDTGHMERGNKVQHANKQHHIGWSSFFKKLVSQ
jgi:hypothetical protein